MKKNKDVAAGIHRGLYGKDKSDKANNPQNRNPHFQAGYKVGTDERVRFDLWDERHPITVEWKRIGSPKRPPKSFTEWKRGYAAATMQKAVAFAFSKSKP